MTKPTKTFYLTNKDLLPAIIEAKQQGKLTDKLALMLQLLCAKYAKKGNFANYTYNDDMQAYAMLMLVRTWNSFDLAKSNNPFAFFTQCIKNSFRQYLNVEKRQRTVRDSLMVKNGLNPSYAFLDEANDHQYADDEQDYYFHHETAVALNKQLSAEDHIEPTDEFDDIDDDDLDLDDEDDNIEPPLL